MIVCRRCGKKIAETEREFSEKLTVERSVIRVKTGPPGFADFDEFHAECVGGRVVEMAHRGSLAWHLHENGHRCTGGGGVNGVNCTGSGV